MILNFVLAALLTTPAAANDITGAWQIARNDGATGTLIVTEEHFSIAWYQREPAKFLSTEGGSWVRDEGGGVRVTYEFYTADPEKVGTTRVFPEPTAAGWRRLDSGAPGALQGAWLMTGRKRDGEITTRKPGARRTMKILSGTRFQWIAYNVETKQFFGTGGGTYTTKDGKYTETIEFFSRDDKRAGMNLEFQYQLVDGAWHHIGKSTAGEPMHELWSRRKDLGI